MVRNTFLFAVVVGVCLSGQTAIAQPPKPVSIAERLSKPVEFKYEATPLKEVVEDLKKRLKVSIVIETKVLEEAGISLENPIKGEVVEGKSRGGTALEDLNDLLRPYKLGVEIRHNALIITTLERHTISFDCRIYRVLKAGADTERLIDQITSKLAPDSWDQRGGVASIKSIGRNVLVILQTPAIHREINKKFGEELSLAIAPLDRVAALVPTKGVDPLANMRAVLSRQVSVEFAETPFRKAVESLAKTQKLPLVMDGNAFATAFPYYNLDTPVTVNLQELPVESMLTLVLDGMGMGWALDGERLLITLPAVAKGRLITINYDVRDLAPTADPKALSQALTRTVQPVSWAGTKGPGTFTAAEGELSITQTVQVHRLIETWLADLRTALKPVPAEK
ncbi:MAG: hypothetical protein IAF94_02745 [Pirellulaceae bacterium]|nr:hypothetical protein [Pirellulaceae bacterium]